MILIDYSAIAISNIVTQKLDIQEDMVRHMILNSIRMYRSKFKEKYGEVVIAGDAGNNWRYGAFPQYKAARKKNRKESKMDWQEIFRIINLVWEVLNKPLFPGLTRANKTANMLKCQKEAKAISNLKKKSSD